MCRSHVKLVKRDWRDAAGAHSPEGVVRAEVPNAHRIEDVRGKRGAASTPARAEAHGSPDTCFVGLALNGRR